MDILLEVFAHDQEYIEEAEEILWNFHYIINQLIDSKSVRKITQLDEHVDKPVALFVEHW